MTLVSTDPVQALKARFGELISPPIEFRGEITLDVVDAEKIADVCAHAKAALGFDYLVDLSGVDFYGEDPRWMVVYELYNHQLHRQVRLRTRVTEEKSELPTVSHVWRTADWHERECFDMLGIRFRGHPDLRRILMWEGYPYFPLRKDFPLAGKSSELPDVAFTRRAPQEGGPFVTTAGVRDAVGREPRAKAQDG